MINEKIEKIEMAFHNLLCYSANYAMTIPKEGFEQEWKDAKLELAKLQF